MIEFLIMGKPVIEPRTQGIRDYFDENSLFFFEPGNVDDLARVILNVYSDSARRQQIVKEGSKVYQQHRWELEGKHLVNLVKGLLRNGASEI